jgi:hypothetical protein
MVWNKSVMLEIQSVLIKKFLISNYILDNKHGKYTMLIIIKRYHHIKQTFKN